MKGVYWGESLPNFIEHQSVFTKAAMFAFADYDANKLCCLAWAEEEVHSKKKW